MATFAAVSATSAALLGLLESAAQIEDEFAGAAFPLLRSDDLQKSPPDRLAVSLYLYHVGINASRRTAADRWNADGSRRPQILPLDLHYLMTAWAKDAGTQQRLLGWAISVVQDTPTLPAGLLNSYGPQPVFRPDETVEVLWETLSQQDVYDIWDVARSNQQPSAAYVARVIEIESAVPVVDYPLVQATQSSYGTVP
jgi:Pvc16 N-terminal domain